ncbi:MAG TPA: hypothetical protein VF596_02325 [Pyrinomonadaceae bacterium]|jgi:hypothetical protein
MEFDLKEISITLALGAYVLLGFELLCYLYWQNGLGLNLLKTVTDKNVSPYYLIALSVVACFVIGLLAETLSDKLVDEDDSWIQRNFFKIISETDDDMKVKSLFEMNRGNYLRDITKEKLFSVHLDKETYTEGQCLEKNIQYNDLEGSKNSIKDCCQPIDNPLCMQSIIKRFYYHAKNVVFNDPEYSKELQKVQMRIDFARSFSLISIVLAMISGLFLLIHIVVFSYKWIRYDFSFAFTSSFYEQSNEINKAEVEMSESITILTRDSSSVLMFKSDKNGKKENQNANNPNVSRIISIILGFILTPIVFSILCFAGAYAFKEEERNFDVRVYGYFASIKLEKKLEKKEQNNSNSSSGTTSNENQNSKNGKKEQNISNHNFNTQNKNQNNNLQAVARNRITQR